jgi:Mrp family chromosome partitioning ATPase/uncharacterized protein involved in exopolysaccharide biosynthesis
MASTRRVAAPQDRTGETWNLLYRFGQHWLLALLVGVFAATLGFLYARSYEPIYHAEAQVRVGDNLDAHLSNGQKDDNNDTTELPENLASSFRTRFLVDPKLEALVRELSKEAALQRNEKLKTSAGREELIEHIKQHVQVEPVTRRVYRVIYDGHDPLLVQRVVQRVAEIGVADVVEQRSATARQARAFLTAETESSRQKMLETEAEVVRFLRNHPGMMVSAGAERSKLGLSAADKLLVSSKERGPGMMPVQALDASNSPQVRALLSERADLEARVTQIEAAQKFDPVQTKVNEIERLQQQLSELKAQNYTKEYPEFQRISSEIDKVQQEIRENKSRRDKNLAADLRTLADAKTQMAALDRQIALLRQKASGGSRKAQVPDVQALSAEAEYARLTRDMETVRTGYEKLHERELDAQVNEELSKVKGNLAARIEEPAKLPTQPRGASRKMMMALCVLLGLGLGLLAGAFRALTDPHIYTVYDLTRASKLPVLGRVPPRDGQTSQGLTEVSGDAQAGNGKRGRSERTPDYLRDSEGSGAVLSDRSAFLTPAGVPYERLAGAVPIPMADTRTPATGASGPAAKAWSSDYMVVYSAQRDASSGQVVAPATATSSGMFAERSRSALMASPQSAAFRLAAMGHILHQGQLPDLHHLFLHSAPDGARAEQYRLLRCRLQDQSDPRVLVVTSALRGEGKTTAAANLALAYAEGGAHSVVLVDAHLSAPRLTEMLGAQPRAEALVDPDAVGGGLEVWQYAPNLFLVPALGPRVKRSAVLSSPAFAMLIADLRQTFDYVILDSPAVASAADAKIVMRCADAGLFLVRARSTTGKAVSVALDRLGRRVMAGAVLNEFGKAG